MSHLSILPTVLSDLERLETALHAEGYVLTRQSKVETLGSGLVAVDLLASKPDGDSLAWRWSASQDHLELVTDLQRQASRSGSTRRLRRIIRRYALLQALDTVFDSDGRAGTGWGSATAQLIID